MTFKSYLSVFVLAILVAGCYPKGPEYIQDMDIVITQKSPDYDFGATKTYYMPDSISYQSNIDDQEPDASFERDLLNEIETQMSQRGYVRLDSITDTVDLANPANPDMVMIVTGVLVKNSGGGWIPTGGCWWYPCWGWGWGWGGWVPYTYSYTTGSVIMDLGDFKNGNTETKRFPLTWEGIMNGLASSSSSNNQSRAISGVRKAFEQSPYLQSNVQ